jgi:hypothetical protein
LLKEIEGGLFFRRRATFEFSPAFQGRERYRLVCGRRVATVEVNSFVAEATRFVWSAQAPALKRRARIRPTLRLEAELVMRVNYKSKNAAHQIRLRMGIESLTEATMSVGRAAGPESLSIKRGV